MLEEDKEKIYQGSLKKLADRCRTFRIRKNWTPYDLCIYADISIHTVYAIERGTGNITIKTLEAVAFALEIKAVDLLSDQSSIGEG